MDRGGYEKISITESVGHLKTYGSTSRHVSRQENYIKHYVSNTDTLQGIALRYNVTIEQIRRVNKLWASDSLFLREFLLIPTSEPSNTNQEKFNDIASPSNVSSPTSISSFDCDNVDDFLGKIDAAIAVTKEDVKKTTKNSKFHTGLDLASDRCRPDTSRMKQSFNNNSSNDLYQNTHAVVVQHGKKVKSSLQQHEQQQAELFEL